MAKLIGKTDKAEIFISGKGYIKVVMGRNVVMDAEEMEKHYRIIDSSTEGKPAPVLIDSRYVSTTTREAQQLGISERFASKQLAVAMIVGNAISRFIGSFFVNIRKPPFPFKMFTSEPKALEWLEQFLEKSEIKDL